MRGSLFLNGRDFRRAADAYAQGLSVFAGSRWAPLSAWGQIQALHGLGKEAEAARAAARLARSYPDSIPAQFAVKHPGEIWVVPFI